MKYCFGADVGGNHYKNWGLFYSGMEKFLYKMGRFIYKN